LEILQRSLAHQATVFKISNGHVSHEAQNYLAIQRRNLEEILKII